MRDLTTASSAITYNYNLKQPPRWGWSAAAVRSIGWCLPRFRFSESVFRFPCVREPRSTGPLALIEPSRAGDSKFTPAKSRETPGFLETQFRDPAEAASNLIDFIMPWVGNSEDQIRTLKPPGPRPTRAGCGMQPSLNHALRIIGRGHPPGSPSIFRRPACRFPGGGPQTRCNSSPTRSSSVATPPKLTTGREYAAAAGDTVPSR